jgi:hypothetical protein
LPSWADAEALAISSLSSVGGVRSVDASLYAAFGEEIL